MKNKKWIEMLIGLSTSGNSINGNALSDIYRFGKAKGISELTINRWVNQHLNWCYNQGYEVVLACERP